MKGLVVKKNAGVYTIETGNEKIEARAFGKTKKLGIYVGDMVEFDDAIKNVLPRKNLLIRPPLANLDKLFIVIAPVPKPDFVLVDKLIIYSKINGISPVLVVNKDDLQEGDFKQNIKAMYEKVLKIVFISKTNLTPLLKQIVGICAFAGQSAVGKSTLTNLILGDMVAEVGQLSKKIERGKQTTRATSLFKYQKGYIADTAGFSLLDTKLTLPVEPSELGRYYPDFLEFIPNCKFRSCTHENGKNCAIIEAVKEGNININRYKNYLKILKEIKEER